MIDFSLEFWIIFASACFLLELMSGGFYLMSVGIGSSGAGIANYIGLDPTTQLIIFVLVTLIFIVISRPLAKKLTKGSPDKKATSDRLIGKEGVVTEPIDPENAGMIKIYGETWRTVAKEDIEVGEKVIVKKVKGVKLSVRKK